MSRQVNLKTNFLIKDYFSQKGQALVELATFGTVLLFCLAMLVNYGLQANYQQEMEMKAFRQAMQESYNNVNRGPSGGSQSNLIEDKPGITAQDPYGVSERYAFGAGASVSWNNDIVDEFVDANNRLQDGQAGTKDYRPKVSYNLNGTTYGPYTTADFRQYPCSGNITVRIPLLPGRGLDTNGDGKEDKFWKDITINCATQTKVFLDESVEKGPQPLIGYIRNDAEFLGKEKEQFSGVLLKDRYGGSRLASVVMVYGKITEIEKNGKKEKVGGPIESFWVLDSQAGQIDTAIEIPHNPDGSNKLEEYAKRRQGLLPDSVKTIDKSGSFEKKETFDPATKKGEIATTTDAFSSETITRKIRLNNAGAPIDARKELPYGREITWTTPK